MIGTAAHPDRYRAWLDGLLGVPVTDGNHVEVLRNGDEIFPRMLETIKASRATVDLLTFAFAGSIAKSFVDALTERAAAGVRVRVLLDAFAALGRDVPDLDGLKRAGARVHFFRPLSNPRVWETAHRGHRKVLVCDGTVAFTGGVGIADQWRGDARSSEEWRDNHFHLEGPAVDGLHAAFVNNWAETGEPLFELGVDRFPVHGRPGHSAVQVVRAGARTGWGDMATLAHTLIALSRHRLRIAAAYFVPDEQTLVQLCEAARRGVAVELLVNGPQADNWVSRLATKAQYGHLLDAGVTVWEFQPTMLHAKVITVDGAAASVGSANFNARSLLLDEEVNIVVFDRQVVAVLDRSFDDDLSRAEEIDAAAWARRSNTRKALELLPGLIARHL